MKFWSDRPAPELFEIAGHLYRINRDGDPPAPVPDGEEPRPRPPWADRPTVLRWNAPANCWDLVTDDTMRRHVLGQAPEPAPATPVARMEPVEQLVAVLDSMVAEGLAERTAKGFRVGATQKEVAEIVPAFRDRANPRGTMRYWLEKKSDLEIEWILKRR